MRLIVLLRAYAIALFACLVLPANAMAAFSLAVAETAHKATAGQDAAVPAFPTADGCDNATTDSGKIACTTKAIAGASCASSRTSRRYDMTMARGKLLFLGTR